MAKVGSRMRVIRTSPTNSPSPSSDLLALVFTVCKILYVNGAGGVVSDLVAVIEPTRAATGTPLHTVG